MKYQTSNIEFTQFQIEKVFKALISVETELKNYFENYLFEEYKGNLSERLSYFDTTQIARFLINKLKLRETDFFYPFFNQVELILTNCDSYINDLIIVGLFEGIQNIGGADIDYYFSFDKWLQPLSRQKWDNLIDFWEGQDWRSKKNDFEKF